MGKERQAAKAAKRMDDDLILTIDSDEEVSDHDVSSDDEASKKQSNKNQKAPASFKAVTQQAVAQEVKQKQSEQESALNAEFSFSNISEDPQSSSSGSAWDFSKAIAMAKQNNIPKMSSIDEKIQKIRAEKVSNDKKGTPPQNQNEKQQDKSKVTAQVEQSDSEDDEAEEIEAEDAEIEEDEDDDDIEEDDDDEDVEEDADDDDIEEDADDEGGDSEAAGSDEEDVEEDEDSENDGSDQEEEEEDEAAAVEAKEEDSQHEEQEEPMLDDLPEDTVQPLGAAAKAKYSKLQYDSSEDEADTEYFKEDEAKPESDATIKAFTDLNLTRPLLRGIASLQWNQPTPIQARTIPVALSGQDICGSAVTGSGKTGAFMLPILERLLFRTRKIAAIRVLVILPTRELAVQCHAVTERLAQFTDITACLVVGGVPLRPQAEALKARPDIVIATPGRIIDHVLNTQSVTLDELEIFVMDEADRLLELGFQQQLTELVNHLPPQRQTMLFSATMTNDVQQLISLSLRRPVRVAIDAKYDTVSRLTQEFIRLRSRGTVDREAILLSLVTRVFRTETIVFSLHKPVCRRLRILLGLVGLRAEELHGDLAQEDRLAALERFRDKKVDFLICTDVAARGLDIAGVKSVINFELPPDLKQYVHRVGRTARAGRTGHAITLVSDADHSAVKKIIKHAKEEAKQRVVPKEVVDFWKQRVVSLEKDVQRIMNELAEDLEFINAERQAKKIENIIKYQEQISAKPDRQWVNGQSKKPKRMQDAEVEESQRMEDAYDNEDLSRGDGEESLGSKRKRPQQKKPKADDSDDDYDETRTPDSSRGSFRGRGGRGSSSGGRGGGSFRGGDSRESFGGRGRAGSSGGRGRGGSFGGRSGASSRGGSRGGRGRGGSRGGRS